MTKSERLIVEEGYLVLALATAHLVREVYRLPANKLPDRKAMNTKEWLAVKNIFDGLQKVRQGFIAFEEETERHYTKDLLKDYNNYKKQCEANGVTPEVSELDLMKNWDKLINKAKMAVRDFFYSKNYMVDEKEDLPKWDRMLRNAKKHEAISDETIKEVAGGLATYYNPQKKEE